MKKVYSFISLLICSLLILQQVTNAQTSRVNSNQALCSLPITLVNNQASPTPANFEQKLIINSSAYSSHESAGLQNIEFSTGSFATGSLLQAWIERGDSNTSASTLYWLNLGSLIIPANDSVTIYMNFMQSNVMSAAGPTGEAPQLSSPYGQNDNGSMVFNLYTNWAGSSLPLGWLASAGSANYTVNNGLTLTASGGSIFIYYDSAISPTGYILDTYVDTGTAASDGHDELFGWGPSPQASSFVGGGGGWWGWMNGVWSGLHQWQEVGGVLSGSTSQLNPLNITTTYPVVMSCSWQDNTANSSFGNYSGLQTNTSDIPPIGPSYPIGGFISSGGSVTYYWFRERFLAPDSVMPSTEFGIIDCPLFVNPVTNQTNSFILYPNPVVDGTVTLSYFLASNAPVKFVITDCLGRELLSVNKQAQVGTNEELINVSKLAGGVYFVNSYINGELQTTLKFVK